MHAEIDQLMAECDRLRESALEANAISDSMDDEIQRMHEKLQEQTEALHEQRAKVRLWKSRAEKAETALFTVPESLIAVADDLERLRRKYGQFGESLAQNIKHELSRLIRESLQAIDSDLQLGLDKLGRSVVAQLGGKISICRNGVTSGSESSGHAECPRLLAERRCLNNYPITIDYMKL